jgi:signal transduction histidine kinase
MRGRFWPMLVAVAAVIVFGSYLVYSQYLVRQIQAQAAINVRIWSLVQRALLSATQQERPDPSVPSENIAGGNIIGAVLEINQEIRTLGLPMMYRNEQGEYTAVANLPGDPDPAQPDGQQQIREFAQRLERRPGHRVEVPGSGAVIFGDPPLLSWLRWVPWLQVSGALILVLVAVAIIRADLRAERERLWASMARELAHQMGTPLSSLQGWLEVLALPAPERQELASGEHIARVMAADIERLERVSRRFELIGKPPALDTVSLSEIVGELRDYFGPRLPKFGKGITLRARVEAGVPAVRANRVLLAWALENVVKNAVDALGGRGGRIMILAHNGADGQVHVHIGDNGPGIPATLRDRIFEPGVSTKAGGWGVGLSLTRRIVRDLHGGQITVRPRRRGGTVFDIRLPPAAA